jgi:hypothetical protein
VNLERGKLGLRAPHDQTRFPAGNAKHARLRAHPVVLHQALEAGITILVFPFVIRPGHPTSVTPRLRPANVGPGSPEAVAYVGGSEVAGHANGLRPSGASSPAEDHPRDVRPNPDHPDHEQNDVPDQRGLPEPPNGAVFDDGESARRLGRHGHAPNF